MKMSLRDHLYCLVDFVGKILLAVLFLLPCRTLALPTALRLPSLSPSCFFRVCFPTLFATVLKDFLPPTTSAFSGTANSNNSTPTRFAAGTIYLRKNGIAVLPITCARAPYPFPSVFQPFYSMEILLVLKQPFCRIVCVKNEWKRF